MDNNLVWLHLSDWHQEVVWNLDRERVRDALIEDLKGRRKIDPRLAEINFLVFSGDLAFSGSPAEYEKAEREFLDPILQVTGVPKDHLFLVPGNHDLERSALKLLAPLSFQDEREVNELLQNRDAREVVLAPMRAYSRFVRKYLKKAAPKEPSYSYLYSFQVGEIPIALVGMNSAWRCAQRWEENKHTGEKEVRDQGYLLLGEPQFSEYRRKPEFRNAKIRIGVLHHPASWFNKELSRWSVEESLERTFDFLLHGHEHESIVFGKSRLRSNCIVISAGAAYDRRECHNGYNFVHLDLRSGQGTLFFRRYDERRGFHKDTVITDDDSPGVYTFSLPEEHYSVPAAMPGNSLVSRDPLCLSVHLIRDVYSDDVIAALDLYERRIPGDERFQAPDIMRWLREDQEEMAAGAKPANFFFVAKQADHVCGFTLLHYHAQQRLAFVAYLVAEKGVGYGDEAISARLLAKVAKLFAPGSDLDNCQGILLEVDDPRPAKNEETLRERLARIRLFSILAAREGFTLRALDLEYRQPLLDIPTSADRGKEVPMLLMYAERIDGVDAALPRDRAQFLLKFIYKWLYPEGFSEIPARNDAYKSYLNAVYMAHVTRLPELVPFLSLKEIQSQCEAALQIE